MPTMVKLINKIPWNCRYTLTLAATIFMLVDGLMTLQSLDCWYMRLSYDGTGSIIETPISEFYEEHFDNDYMEARFESMSINPQIAVRGDTN